MIAVITYQIKPWTYVNTVITNHINNLKYSSTHKYSPKPADPTTMVPANTRAPPLDGGQSTQIGGMWTLKHDIISQKFYEIIIKTEIKGETVMDLKNFYNHIKMCLNMVTRLR